MHAGREQSVTVMESFNGLWSYYDCLTFGQLCHRYFHYSVYLALPLEP